MRFINQTVADVLPVASRARDDGLVAEPVGTWGPYAEHLIAAELVACTLGQRVRPELLTEG